jgi:hypothetical protein
MSKNKNKKKKSKFLEFEAVRHVILLAESAVQAREALIQITERNFHLEKEAIALNEETVQQSYEILQRDKEIETLIDIKEKLEKNKNKITPGEPFPDDVEQGAGWQKYWDLVQAVRRTLGFQETAKIIDSLKPTTLRPTEPDTQQRIVRYEWLFHHTTKRTSNANVSYLRDEVYPNLQFRAEYEELFDTYAAAAQGAEELMIEKFRKETSPVTFQKITATITTEDPPEKSAEDEWINTVTNESTTQEHEEWLRSKVYPDTSRRAVYERKYLAAAQRSDTTDKESTVVNITDDHVTLLLSAVWRYHNSEYGAPGMDTKRPYGNSGVEADLAELLPHLTEEQRVQTHRELPEVIPMIFEEYSEWRMVRNK